MMVPSLMHLKPDSQYWWNIKQIARMAWCRLGNLAASIDLAAAKIGQPLQLNPTFIFQCIASDAKSLACCVHLLTSVAHISLH